MTELVLKPVSVFRVSKNKVKFLRKSFLKLDKRLFFALAVSEACDWNRSLLRPEPEINFLRKLASFEIHHIVPLSLGGLNSFDNLALVEPRLHKQIHRIIESQGDLPSRKDIRKEYMRSKKLFLVPKHVINIPVPHPSRPNLKVWGLYQGSSLQHLKLV